MAEVKVVGLESTIAALRALPAEFASKNGGPIRTALFAAAKVIKQEAINNAPEGEGTPRPGNIRKNIIAVRDRNPRRQNNAVERYIITVRTKRMAKGSNRLFQILKGGDAWYAFMVEFGTSKQPAQRFMTRAYEAKAAEALAAFEQALRKGVDGAVTRARLKNQRK